MNPPWPFNDGLNLFHESACDLVIPDVLLHDKVRELKVDCIGAGEIFGRLTGVEGSSKKIHKIWCRMAGKEENFQDVQEHDLAIIVFPYSFGLGERASLADLFDELLKESRVVKSTEVKNLLEQHSEKTCSLCQHIVAPGKDVGTLLDKKSGKLVCSSLNSSSGVFHVFHVSCLINWIMLWESETYYNEQVHPLFCNDCLDTRGGARDGEMSRLSHCLGKVVAGINEWIESPEISDKSTIGLCFPEHKQQDSQVLPLKRLTFYRAHPTVA